MSDVGVSAQNCLAGHDSVVSPSAGITGFLISSIMNYFYNEKFISIKKKKERKFGQRNHTNPQTKDFHSDACSGQGVHTHEL